MIGVHPHNRNMSKARRLSQFFTNKKLARKITKSVFKLLWSQGRDVKQMYFIEPSAGDGAFYYLLPKGRRVGVEVDPELIQKHSEYKYSDLEKGGFLSLSKKDLGLSHIPNSMTVVIGNPPYSQPRTRGRSRNFAFDFVQHASKMGDTIALILGTTFRRPRTQAKINPYFHLLYDHDIPFKSFTLDGEHTHIFTCFQIWQKKSTQRPVDPTLLWSKKGRWPVQEWHYVKSTDPKANIRIVNWGSRETVGRMDPLREVAQLVKNNQLKVYQRRNRTGFDPDSSHYYLCCKDPEKVRKRFLKRKHLFRALANDRTLGQNPDLTKLDMVRIYKCPETARYEHGRYVHANGDPISFARL